MYKWLMVLLLVGLTSGCDTVDTARRVGNPNLTDNNVARVKAGMFKEEVFALMGAPSETMVKGDGFTEWIYRGAEGEWNRPTAFSRKSTEIRAKILVVQINSDGVVSNVDYEVLEESEITPFN